MDESYDHDSTAAGNYLRGLAGLNYARGSYALCVSQAAILFEEARSLDVYNRRLWVDFYRGHLRRLESERQDRLAIRRFTNETNRLARYKAAYQLSDEELNRTTGEITWPIALQTVEYAKLRSRLDELFRNLNGDTEDAGVSAEQIAVCVKGLQRGLERNRNSIGREDRLAAQKFLCGLKYEPEFSQPGSTVASARVDESRKLGLK
jgi:hypothetical protein